MKRLVKSLKYSRTKNLSEKELLVEEIEEIRFLMKFAYFKLSDTKENELVESAVLELRSLEIKHAYLLNKLKEVDR